MSSSLNLVFCGTPRFAVPVLDRLVEAGFTVQLVVTQPDRPKGRGLELVFLSNQAASFAVSTADHPA